MKFVCQSDNSVMEFVENVASEGGGSMAVRFRCPTCEREIAMVTNPGETQMVRSLGVTIGHDTLAAAPEPMSMIRNALAGSAAPLPAADGPEPVWTEPALKRLSVAPTFVQGMIRRLYTDYARQQGHAEITPAVMNEARDALGLMGM
ncbi:MAG: hypothetical protein ACT4QE_05270 [Anaerolineales bacterium]